MIKLYLLQVTADTAGPIPYNTHLVILGLIMISSGLIGGFTGYLIERNRNVFSDQKMTQSYQSSITKQLRYFLVTGLSASLLIPLFLSTISSKLMSESQTDPLKYFVFGGFCLLVAVFSKQFISSLSDKLIKDLKEEVNQQAAEKVEKAFEEKKVEFTQQVDEQISKQTSSINSRLNVMDEFNKLENQIKSPTNPRELKLEDLTGLLDQALQSGDSNLPTQVYDKISILCYDLKKYEFLEKILEMYKDKIELTVYSWADLAITNMYSYELSKDDKFKQKALGYLDNSFKTLKNYGPAYSLKIYLDLIDLDNLIEGDSKAAVLNENIKRSFAEISAMGKVTAQEAYHYFTLNDKTAFVKYNELLKKNFPDEWKTLEKNGKKDK